MPNLEELKAEFESLTSDNLPDLEELKAEFKALTGTFSGLGKSLGGLKSVGKEMNKSKFAKAAKGLKDTFKSMIGAAASGDKIGLLMAALKPLMSVLEPLADLFKPFALVLDLITILISALVSSALAPMYEAMQPIYDAIIDLMPIFIDLGTIIGTLIADVLTILIDILLLLLPSFVEFMKQLVESEGFMVLVAIALGILTGAFGPLIIIIATISTLVIGLVTIFTVIANVINDVVMPAIGTFIMGIAVMIDAITLGMAGAVNFVKGLMGTLPSTTKTTTSTYPSDKISKYESMQEGGITLSEGLYHLHNKEIVAPLDPFTKEQTVQKALLGEILSELMNQSSIQRKAYLDKEFKYMFKRT